MKNAKFLANSRGQELKNHLAGVARASELIFGHIVNKETFNKYATHIIFGGLIHDLGKCSPDFQDYLASIMKKKNNEEVSEDLRGEKGTFVGPYHNEISSLILKSLTHYDEDIVSDGDYLAYWHHASNYDFKTGKLRFERMSDAFDKFLSNQLKVNPDFQYDDLLRESLEVYKEALEVFKKSSDLDVSSLDRILSFSENSERKLRDRSFSRFKRYRVVLGRGVEDIDDTARKTLLLTVMVEADKWVSSLPVDELDLFLSDKSYSERRISDLIQSIQGLSSNELGFKPIAEGTPQHRVIQSKEQDSLAEKASGHKLSICGVDPSGGKTSISVIWWNKLNQAYGKKKAIFILPRQHQTDSLFKGISKEINRIVDGDVSVQSFHSGSVQFASNPKLVGKEDSTMSDINIMVFDRLILGLYDRKKISEMFKSLFSHLIIDEFHEFNSIPRMILGLAEILHIRRHYLRDVKTLLLSGTPDLPLLDVCGIRDPRKADFFFDRSNMSPQQKELTLEMKEKPLQDTRVEYSPNTLYTFATISDAQNFDPMGDYEIAHSRMIPNQKNKLILDILESNGESHFLEDQKPVVSSKLFQSSFDMCFKEIHSEISLPFTDIQTIGRNNRFGKRSDAKFVFYPAKNERLYSSGAIGGQEVHINWFNHVSEKVSELDGEKIGYRDLITTLFDEFMNKDENYKSWKNEILVKTEREVKTLENMIPKRTFSKSKGKNIVGRINDEGLRGGDQFYVTAPIVENGELKGWLGGDDESTFITTSLPRSLVNEYRSKTEVLMRDGKNGGKDFVEETLRLKILGKYGKFQIGKSELYPIVLESFNKEDKFSNYYDPKKGLIFNGEDDDGDI